MIFVGIFIGISLAGLFVLLHRVLSKIAGINIYFGD